MTRFEKFIKNVLVSVVHQIVLILSGFITIKVILENYGAEVNGFINSINQFLVYFKLVEGGLAAAVIYALYKPLVEKNLNKRNEILTASKKIYINAGNLFLCLIFLLALIYPLFISIPNQSYIQMSVLIMVLGFSNIIDFYTLAKYRVLLTADQKSYIISIATIIHLIVNTFIIWLLAQYGVDFVILWACATSTVLIRTFILIIYTNKNYEKLNYHSETPDYEALNQKWASLFNQVLGAIQLGAPVILLTVITKDLILVSVYVVYSLVINGLNGILGIFKTGIYSGFGEMLQQGDMKKFQIAFKQFEYAYQSLIVIIFATAYISFIPFIELYTKNVDGEYASNTLAILFIINAILYNIKIPQGMLIYSAGKFKETRLQVSIQALILLLFGIPLTYFYGLEGVLYASIISNLYRVIDMAIYVPRNISKLSIKKTLIRYLQTIVSIYVVILIADSFIELNVNGYLFIFIQAFLIILLALIVVSFTTICFDKKLFIGLKSRFIKNKI